MCRLLGMTFTDPDLQPRKAEMLDRLMLVSQTDEGQNDGWGVTDGIAVIKSEKMYSASTPLWRRELDPAEPWLAHVRKASAGMGRTALESHPYEFEVNGVPLFAAHNGMINGTVWKTGTDIPNTDSYRAFTVLTQIMEGTQQFDLTAALFAEWMTE